MSARDQSVTNSARETAWRHPHKSLTCTNAAEGWRWRRDLNPRGASHTRDFENCEAQFMVGQASPDVLSRCGGLQATNRDKRRRKRRDWRPRGSSLETT